MSPIPPYIPPPETSQSLPWADLTTLDLSLLSSPSGTAHLVSQLSHAVHNVGFFYIKNFGISEEEIRRQYAFGKEFYQLGLEEKLRFYDGERLRRGEYNGYRPEGLRQITEDVKDNVQVFNIPSFSERERQYPEILQDHIEEIEEFSKKVHNQILLPLLPLFSISLSLPPSFLTAHHIYTEPHESHLRYMYYSPRTRLQNASIGNIYTAGHTDLGTFTLLFHQPISGLQILNKEGEWKWVKSMEGGVVVNVGDALSALSGGWARSCVHRVVTAPEDQRGVDGMGGGRLGVLYFARPNNHLILNPIPDSPILNSLNYTTNEFTELGKKVSVGEWVQVRQTQQQRKAKPVEVTREGRYSYKEKDLEILPGLNARVYN